MGMHCGTPNRTYVILGAHFRVAGGGRIFKNQFKAGAVYEYCIPCQQLSHKAS